MIYKEGNKVVIRIAGAILQFGDIAVIKQIDYARLIDTYYCYCELRQAGEWMAPQHLDKYQERPVNKAPVYDRIKNAVKELDNRKEPIVRPKSEYSNLPSPYGIADELKSGKEIK